MDTSQDRQWLRMQRANPTDPALRKMGLHVVRTIDRGCRPPPPSRQLIRGLSPPSRHSNRGQTSVFNWPQREAITAIRFPNLSKYSERQNVATRKTLSFEPRDTGNSFSSNRLHRQGSTRSSQVLSVYKFGNPSYIYWTQRPQTFEHTQHTTQGFDHVIKERIQRQELNATTAPCNFHRSVNLARRRVEYLEQTGRRFVFSSTTSISKNTGLPKSKYSETSNALLDQELHCGSDDSEKLPTQNSTESMIEKSANSITVVIPY